MASILRKTTLVYLVYLPSQGAWKKNGCWGTFLQAFSSSQLADAVEIIKRLQTLTLVLQSDTQKLMLVDKGATHNYGS